MRCPGCGNENKESAKFCFKCGFKFQKLVPPPGGSLQSKETTPVSPPVLPVSEDLSTRPLMSASLVFKEGSKEIILPYKPVSYIGREDKSSGYSIDIDLTEVDRGKVVSRKHGYISCSEGKYRIADQGSMNGTFVNNTRLEKDIEYDLKNGDEIIFGKLSCIFKCMS